MTQMKGFELFGVNLAGAEFAPDSPGRLGRDYIYPGVAHLDYYASKGMNVIRLPFLWERLQPTANGPLDAEDLGYVKAIVEAATARGMSVILDVHNYGYYKGSLVGRDVPNSVFADLWSKLSTEFKANPGVIFGLMNEPYKQSASEWVGSTNAAIAAIRATGATQQILVSGTAWSGAHSWTGWSGNATVFDDGVRDPLDNFAFDIHSYFDSDASGTSAAVVSSTIGVERLKDITAWARQHGHDLFLGEFATTADAVGVKAIGNMLDYMAQNRDVWLGGAWWGAGPWWGDYFFSVEPVNGIDRPQMDLLELYVGGLSSGTGSSDAFAGRPGKNTYDGGAGLDCIDYAGLRRAYTVVGNAASRTVTSRADGTDTLRDVEVLDFVDGQLVFDVALPEAVAFRLYDAAFNRRADAAGLNHWTNQIEAGASLDAVASGFMLSPEFQASYGHLTNQAFVEQLYRNVLDRAGDQGGVTYWTELLNASAHTRNAVLASFSESAEHIEITRSGVEAGLFDLDEEVGAVARLYYAALDRAPDVAGLVYHDRGIKAGASLRDLADSFAASSEFQAKYGILTNQRFVEQLYLNVLDRAGDQGSIDYWTGLLNQGVSRGEVLLGFSESSEHQAKTAALIHDGILVV